MDLVPEIAPRLGIDAGGRLVQQQQLRIGQRAGAERQALLPAAGEFAGELLFAAIEAEPLDHLARGASRIAHAIKPRDEFQIFAHRQILVQAEALRHVADLALTQARYDLEDPSNRAKLVAVDQLAELAAKAGHTLPELSVAFVLDHPGVTSAIIGPRTMDQLTTVLSAAEITLDDGVLDRIDEIVPPGRDLNPADNGWTPPWVSEAALRRR